VEIIYFSSGSSAVANINKIGKAYSLEYNNIPKAFFTQVLVALM
jgi:hypothetical protein